MKYKNEAAKEARVVDQTTAYPKQKLTIIGGGIIGFLEAYYAYLHAKQRGERIRITMYDKNQTLKNTTTAHIYPSLTPDEILSVVPRGQELINKLQLLFSEPGGIRVDDVDDVNESSSANEFKAAVQAYGLDNDGHLARTETLLALGKTSMDLWQAIYDNGDFELKKILNISNFSACRERENKDRRELHQGYRIDLIYNVPDAINKASAMKSAYEGLGYSDCCILSPAEVIKIDPFLSSFCDEHSESDACSTSPIWKNDAVALWRPGGCIDTQMFLPLFNDYLQKVMGQYINDAGIAKDCFRFKLQKRVEQVNYSSSVVDGPANSINGLKFFGDLQVKKNKHPYPESTYVFCPGESVGTLRNLGFIEPAYARFAGVSLTLRIDVPEKERAKFANFNHCMEVHQEGIVLTWQARFINNQILIGVAGTKAFYGDKQPNKMQAFAMNRNLLQLNIVNNVLPALISLALGKPTKGRVLTSTDLAQLEKQGIAKRWVGTRAVAYDGFPIVGQVHNSKGAVNNARCTTGLGSGGVSFGPAVVHTSQNIFFKPQYIQNPALIDQVLAFGDSKRTPNL